MEQLGTFYNQANGGEIISLEQPRPILNAAQVSELLLRFISQLDLSTLLGSYLQAVSENLPLNGLCLTLSDEQLCVGENQGDYHQRQRVVINSKQSIQLDYHWRSQLGLHQQQLQRELHALVKQPLQNALTHHQLKRLAMRDHLTGLGNRASYQDTLQHLLSSAQRHQHIFSLLTLDLDNFKQVNDQQGHQQGDQVLIKLASILGTSLRACDFAFRFGGDEFCCILPETNLATSQGIAERIRHTVANDTSLRECQVTCSIGTACYQNGDDQQSLFQRADNALYAAKAAGRNTVVAA